jgi:anti-sigma factor RsiW
MNEIEEKLWNYIDGSCSAAERQAIAALIEKDTAWSNIYADLLEMNKEISVATLDEPPMAFSYKVMEGIRAHEATKPLKTKLNIFVIKSIAIFSILSTLILLACLFTDAERFTAGGEIANDGIDLSIFSSGDVVKAFLFLDIMLALFLGDQMLRTGRNNTAPKSV